MAVQGQASAVANGSRGYTGDVCVCVCVCTHMYIYKTLNRHRTKVAQGPSQKGVPEWPTHIRCVILLVTMNMQNETTVRCQRTLNGVAIIKRPIIPSTGKDLSRCWNSIALWQEYKLGQSTRGEQTDACPVPSNSAPRAR